jgi:hypothetical protein
MRATGASPMPAGFPAPRSTALADQSRRLWMGVVRWRNGYEKLPGGMKISAALFVADENRLLNVTILLELVENELRHFCPLDPAKDDAPDVRGDAEWAARVVFPERSRPDDRPIRSAFPDQGLLSVLVCVDTLGKEREDDSIIDEPAVPLCFARTDAGDADQAANIAAGHRCQKPTCGIGKEGGVFDHSCAEKVDDSIDVDNRRLNRARIERVTINNVNTGRDVSELLR